MIDHLVSIIMPSYNSSRFISQSIESVVSQTYTDWELLITDDCSTDDTCDIVRKYAETDNRIKLFKLSQNSGAGVARNNSIQQAKGRYIAFLDSDDLWQPTKLEKQINFLKTNGYQFCHSYTLVVDDNNKAVGLNKKPYRVSFNSTKLINYIGTSSVLYDTKDIGKFYMRPIRRRQDFALWLNILQKTKYAYCIPEPLFIYRYTPNSLSSKKFKLLKYHIEVYQQALGYSKIHASLLFYCLSLPCFVFKKTAEKLREFFYKQDNRELQKFLK